MAIKKSIRASETAAARGLAPRQGTDGNAKKSSDKDFPVVERIKVVVGNFFFLFEFENG